jgi:hypothetical protein
MSTPPASQAQKKQFQEGRQKFRDISLSELSKYEKLFIKFDSDSEHFPFIDDHLK